MVDRSKIVGAVAAELDARVGQCREEHAAVGAAVADRLGLTSPSAEGDASLDAGATRHVPPASATGQVSSLDTSGDPPPASTPTTYKVVKAITSKRGILGPGDRITAEDIRGDEASVRESLRALERAGRIVRS